MLAAADDYGDLAEHGQHGHHGLVEARLRVSRAQPVEVDLIVGAPLRRAFMFTNS